MKHNLAQLLNNKSLTYFLKSRVLWVSFILVCGISFQFSGFFRPLTSAHASVSSIGIATYISVNGSNVQDGDIISSGPNGYYLSNTPYDPNAFGVVTAHPAVIIKTTAQKGYPVISIGTVYLRVSGFNGSIKEGDMVTTSTTAGVGMKALASGYVIGESLVNATYSNKSEIKEIPVSLNLHYLQLGYAQTSSFSDLLKISENAADQQPVRVFQYIMAALIITLSFVFGFLIFVRFINTGIQALGRNPLASRTIQLSILMNVVLVIIILISGVALAYFMIRL